jgi:hypothetical protein
MSGCKCNISLIIVLVSLFSIQAFSRQINYRGSIAEYNSGNFSIGDTLQMSKLNDIISLFSFNGSKGFYSP